MSDELIQPRSVDDIVKDLQAATETPSPEITDEEVKNAVSYEPPAELEGLAAVYAEDDVEKQKKKCLEEIDKVLKKHDGMESNISLKHEYWDLTALYRKLNANP